jgi:hypothetical protein
MERTFMWFTQWICQPLLLLIGLVLVPIQIWSSRKAQRDGGDLLYRQGPPWRHFSLARRAMIVGVVLFALFCLGTSLAAGLAGEWWMISNSLLGLLVAGELVYDACTGFPYSGLELRANAMLRGCGLLAWEKVEEYCWMDPRPVLRLKIEHVGYWERGVDPADRAVIDAILQEQHIPLREPGWKQPAGAGLTSMSEAPTLPAAVACPTGAPGRTQSH